MKKVNKTASAHSGATGVTDASMQRLEEKERPQRNDAPLTVQEPQKSVPWS